MDAGPVCAACCGGIAPTEPERVCDDCGAWHHLGCWREAGGCGECPPDENPSARRLDPAAREAAGRWLTYARWTLFFSGGTYGLLALGVPPLIVLAIQDAGARTHDDGGAVLLGAFGVVAFLMVGAFALLHFVVAWGLARRARWAWVVGLVIGAIYLPSICFPLGGLIFYALLRPDVRATMGVS